MNKGRLEAFSDGSHASSYRKVGLRAPGCGLRVPEFDENFVLDLALAGARSLEPGAFFLLASCAYGTFATWAHGACS